MNASRRARCKSISPIRGLRCRLHRKHALHEAHIPGCDLFWGRELGPRIEAGFLGALHPTTTRRNTR